MYHKFISSYFSVRGRDTRSRRRLNSCLGRSWRTQGNGGSTGSEQPLRRIKGVEGGNNSSPEITPRKQRSIVVSLKRGNPLMSTPEMKFPISTTQSEKTLETTKVRVFNIMK